MDQSFVSIKNDLAFFQVNTRCIVAPSTLGAELRKAGYAVLKRLADVVASIVLLILLCPLFLLIAAAIKFDSKGPILYRHRRIGRYGKEITVLKFRSMAEDAEHLEKYLNDEQMQIFRQHFKLRDDPRVTAVGRFLRKWSLDELPQLLNILAGQMSLVGPRPVTRTELSKYGAGTNLLLSVKPGLTGLWQVNGRSETTYGKRISLDLDYIESKNVLLDFQLLLRTAKVIFRHAGAY